MIFLYGCTGKDMEISEPLGKITGQPIKDTDKPDTESDETIKNVAEEPTQEASIDEKAIDKLEKGKNIAGSDAKYIDIMHLQNNLSKIVRGKYYNFSRDLSRPEYIRSSDLKYYVIHTINDEKKYVKTADDFCDEYCAENWDDWKYFINASDLGDLTPILERGNFSTDARYKEYKFERTLINHTFIETTYEVKNGKVLEYQFISWTQDQFNTFEGAWFGTFLIYKIYCSPNATIFLRPKWDEYKDLSFPAATMSSTYRTWVNYIKPIREELLGRANELLGLCPVEKDFFQDYSFPDYFKSEMLSYYWKIDYEYLWNMTSSIRVGAVPSLEEGKYLLKEVNVSFRNNDEYDINEEINLRIMINPDDKGEQEYHDGGAGGKLISGKSIERSMRKKDIEFTNNITVEAKLYTVDRKGDIRPLKVTFTKADLGFE